MNSITFPLTRRMQGPTVADLQEALRRLVEDGRLLADDEGAARELLVALERERDGQSYGPATAKLVGRYQEERGIRVSGDVDEESARALNDELMKDEDDEDDDEPSRLYRVEGRVVSRTSASIGGLRVDVMDRSVGKDVLVAEAETQARGAYTASFPRALVKRLGKTAPDLQVRVFDGERLLAVSGVRYDASSLETIDVVLDERRSRGLRSEYETLTGAVAATFDGKLGDLQETDERQDVSYLANKTGWDARAVAIAALADQFSARTGRDRGIEPGFFYALFRAGLSADEPALFRTEIGTVESIWRAAIVHDVIPTSLEERLPDAVGRFQELAAARLLDGPAPVGISSFRELAARSIEDEDGQAKFAALYSSFGTEPATFWDAVRAAFGDRTTSRLVLDGQLAFLTLNNAPLISNIHAAAGEAGLQDARDLVTAGLYQAQAWREMAGEVSVPREIPGKDEAERRMRYADMLAAQVRLSFPTAVVARMVELGETPVRSDDMRKPVNEFLVEHEGRFQIGMQPVAQYVARNDIDLPVQVTGEIARIQRVYQITPDESAMNLLLSQGIDSASAVAGYERESFIRAFRGQLGGEEKAAVIHAKAQQVHSAVVNLAFTFLTARNAPGIGVHSAPSIIDPNPRPPANASDVIAYATLESLFGEMDYCACEHCRSILSPAAYLVDLLRLIDRPASEVPAGFTNPLTVLLDRRPDIENLPLTCENTTTPLPYVDLVNETLEYFIANGLTLAGYEGHTTDGTATPAELLASPEFVSDAVYAQLADVPFPPPLPFHQPLASLRRHLARFDAPLPVVMENLRTDDSLDRATPSGYGWRDTWMEYLGLSRAEHQLLTESQQTAGATDVMLTAKYLYGFVPAAADMDVQAILENARSFCRRIGITYEQLVEILGTQFVNPHGHLVPKLERLGVSVATLKALKDGAITDAAFDALLAPGLDASHYGGDIKAWVRDETNYSRIMGLLTLTNPADPEDVCNFENAEFRYANPDPATNQARTFEFIRILRFVRLWKALGWTIPQTDKALSALYPTGQMPDDPSDAVNIDRLNAGFAELAPRLGAVRRVMDLLKLKPARDLLALLACVAPIDTHGTGSLYHQMFLSQRPVDDAFADDGYGNVLGSASEALLDNADTLRAAFSLTANEFAEITDALGYDGSTLLSLDTISAVFRRGWLARKLKLSVRETLLLSQVTGYDPFAMPDPVGPQMIRLIELVTRLRSLGIKPAHVLYLVWHYDLSGRSSPADEEVTGFARTLRAALTGIESELARDDDPDGSIARARMGLVYGSEPTDVFFGLLDGTFRTSTAYDHASDALEPAILNAAPGRIAYDDFRKELVVTGLLTEATRNALSAAGDAAFGVAVGNLFDQNHAVLGPFFERYPELRPLHDGYLASLASVDDRRTALLDALLPALTLRRKRQQALQSITAAAESDLPLAGAILEANAVLHAAGDPLRPALDDVVALERAGLSARYFYGPNATGTPDLVSDTEARLEYRPVGSTTLPPNATTPGTAISGIWSGYVEPPENGFYKLRIDTDATAVTLSLDGSAVTLAQTGTSWENASPVELRAGRLYQVSLIAAGVTDTFVVRWQTVGRGWEVVPGHLLYSATLVARLRAAYVRFLKATSLAALLALTPNEIAHLAKDGDLQISGDGWLNVLPVIDPPTAATATALRLALDAILDFARMKRDLSGSDERVLEVLREPATAMADAGGMLYLLTRWDPRSVEALLTRFGLMPADLQHVSVLARVYDAYRWVSALGVPATALIAATTNDPTLTIVRSLQAALRARYDESSWLDVLQPINDELRSLQRDALVAHVLHGMRSNPPSAHIDTPDKLFEYFLMDVQMDPCMLTSRIRHALSSVQLFIERGLMNLEPRVASSSINASQWQWMQRYRVWEANRKVFLYPENWLEPELRDNQSPFFKEIMSELLQGDITEDRAAQAFIGYLTKLEEVAKLEVCAIHWVENEPGLGDEIAHVIARTAGANRKYFYRRRDVLSWTPWEKVSLDIEDNPVLPILWRDRLFLFWLKLIQEIVPEERPAPPPTGTKLADVDPSRMIPSKPPRIKVSAILTWSELIGGKWQPARTSDPARPLSLGTTFELSGSNAFDRSRLRLSALSWTNDALRVIVSNQVGSGSSFFLYNPFSSPELRESKKGAHFSPKRSLDTSGASLKVTYAGTGAAHSVIDNAIPDGAVAPSHPVGGSAWDAPFFYEDARHAFYVTTEEELVSVREWHGFGILPMVRAPLADIPYLVQPIPPLLEKERVPLPVTKQPGFGVVDPAPIDYYISEDAYIKTGLGTLGTVRYGDREIGPSGSDILVARAAEGMK